MKFNTNFFPQLVDHVIETLEDGFEKIHNVVPVFNFVLNQQNLLKESELNLYNACRKLGNVKLS